MSKDTWRELARIFLYGGAFVLFMGIKAAYGSLELTPDFMLFSGCFYLVTAGLMWLWARRK
jgi:hypothetical protein